MLKGATSDITVPGRIHEENTNSLTSKISRAITSIFGSSHWAENYIISSPSVDLRSRLHKEMSINCAKLLRCSGCLLARGFTTKNVKHVQSKVAVSATENAGR